MATGINKIPPPSAAVTDPKTGICDQYWYDYLQALADDLAALTASASLVGNFLENSVAIGVSILNGVAKQIVSLTVPAGDWDVSGDCYYQPNSGTTVYKMHANLSTTSDVAPSTPGYYHEQGVPSGGWLTGDPAFTTLSLLPARFQPVATTTIYLNGFITFSGSTVAAGGYIRARRWR